MDGAPGPPGPPGSGGSSGGGGILGIYSSSDVLSAKVDPDGFAVVGLNGLTTTITVSDGRGLINLEFVDGVLVNIY
jgi:hypothetical protein